MLANSTNSPMLFVLDFHQVGEQKPNDLTTTAGGVPEGALAGPEEEAVPEAESPAEPKTE